MPKTTPQPHRRRRTTVAPAVCLLFVLAAAAGAEDGRAVLLVRVPAKACWQDMAFLAGVGAMTKACDGRAAVVAVDESGEVTREVQDYLRRYRPGRVYVLGAEGEKLTGLAAGHRSISASSADAAACALARTFWRSCATVVLCAEDDYTGGLVAAALAGRLRAPLLFVGKAGASAAARNELKRLGAKEAVLVGRAKAAGVKGQGLAVTELADAKGVLAWMRKRGLAVKYLAAVNPRDRAHTVIKKLSLAGAMLAAAREGMVAPLEYDTRWKVGFSGQAWRGELPKGVAKGKEAARKGVIRLDGREYGFFVTGESKGKRCRLYVDLNGNGDFGDVGEGGLTTGGSVLLSRKRYGVTLGRQGGLGKADVWLTWPTADKVRDDLAGYYAAMGGWPEYLCIVGFPDAIPQAIVAHSPGGTADLPSDLPYANADADPFAEVAVGRLIAENASFATLYASRVITYPLLVDATWQNNIAQARWENTYWPLFENVGFTRQFRHDVGDLKWLVKPAGKVKGKRAREFDEHSPFTRVAGFTHMAHSYWKDLGQTYSWDSTVLLAPTLVESGGCLTCALDRDAGFRSVIARLFRNGAVGFVGNSRPGTANQEQQRMEFWNAVLAGETIGRAHRRAQNSMMLTVLDTNQLTQGGNRYTLHIRTLFGDPAFAMHVPSRPRSAPARVTVQGNVVSVHGPAAWWPVKMRVPEDWKKWKDKPLYVCRGAGTYPVRYWCREQYDREEPYVNAEIRTSKRVKGVRQVQSPAKPLGWGGKYWTDEHADGTRTVRWRVRMLDFDQIQGKIVSKIDRIDYRVAFE